MTIVNTNDAGKAIDRRIGLIRRRGVSLRTSIAECAVMILQHAKDTNDCSRMLKLCEAVPMASERAKLINWAEAYSPISVIFTSDVTKRKVGLRKLDAKGYNPFNVDGAKANPYYDFGKSDDETTELLLTSGDLNEAVVKLAARFEKKLTDGKVAANDIDVVKGRLAALRLLTVAEAA